MPLAVFFISRGFILSALLRISLVLFPSVTTWKQRSLRKRTYESRLAQNGLHWLAMSLQGFSQKGAFPSPTWRCQGQNLRWCKAFVPLLSYSPSLTALTILYTQNSCCMYLWTPLYFFLLKHCRKKLKWQRQETNEARFQAHVGSDLC